MIGFLKLADLNVSKQACDDPLVGAYVQKFTRQHPSLTISGWDGVSDNGEEIYNYLAQEKIKNVVLMGVHTNMCVLGRPFGIRQMVKQGFQVVLTRDLTDCMYDPREKPFVSHARHRTGHRAHREILVPVDSRRRVDARHAQLG